MDEYDILAVLVESCTKVQRALGKGSQEQAYREALVADLRARGLKVHERVPLWQHFHWYRPAWAETLECLVESRVVVVVKAVAQLSQAHKAGALAHLCLSRLRVGLMVNFGSHGNNGEPEYFTNVVERFELGFEQWLDQEPTEALST